MLKRRTHINFESESIRRLPRSPSARSQSNHKITDLGTEFIVSPLADGDDSQMFENIVIDNITPKSLDDEAFDPKNPDYKF